MILPKKIIGLDILRFIMALVMVLFHVQGVLDNSFLNSLALNGFYGTSVFFILSGFILTHVYQNKIVKNDFKKSSFFIKRFCALYPIHICTMFASLVLMFIIKIITKQNFPFEIPINTLPLVKTTETTNIYFTDILQYLCESILLIQAWDYRFLLFNVAAWSVSALFFFYLTFPYFVKKVYQSKHLYILLFLTWGIYIAIPLYLTLIGNYNSEVIAIIHRNPLLRLPEFVSGIIFYNICINTKYNNKKLRPFFLFIAFSGFIGMYYLVKIDTPTWFYLSHNGLFLFTQLALVYSFLNISISNIQIQNYIEKLGKASLSIYMLHLPLLGIYFIAYRLILSSFHSNSFSEIVSNAKNIEYLNIIGLIIFFIILIPLSLFLQEKVFTPIQIKLSNKLIKIREKSKHKEAKFI